MDASVAQPAARSPVEYDPEKIAGIIGTFSEAELARLLGEFTMQDLAGNTGRLLVRRWAELNPQAAAAWVAQLGDPGVRQEMVDAVAVAWSEKDMSGALAWANGLPQDDAKNQALTDLGYELAREDPVGAMQIASRLPAGDDSDAMLLHALAQYASADPEKSRELALALPPGPLRDEALATVATVQAKQDGEAAARFVAENISPGPGLDRAVMGVLNLRGRSNLTDASAWVQTFPPSPLRDQATQSLGSPVAP